MAREGLRLAHEGPGPLLRLRVLPAVQPLHTRHPLGLRHFGDAVGVLVLLILRVGVGLDAGVGLVFALVRLADAPQLLGDGLSEALGPLEAQVLEVVVPLLLLEVGLEGLVAAVFGGGPGGRGRAGEVVGVGQAGLVAHVARGEWGGVRRSRATLGASPALRTHTDRLVSSRF